MMFGLINELRREMNQRDGANRKEIDEKINQMRQILDRGMDVSQRSVQEQFKESRDLIKDTAKKITQFEQTNKRIENFATQLQSLENILKNPKQRGILGEYYLESILKNVFDPSQYQLQYKFKDSTIVDAVIFYQGKVLPIDSKFSMENYNKMIEQPDKEKRKELGRRLIVDIKKRIDETSKYIKTKEKTFDFAFMFIPSEGVYYDLISAKIGALKETGEDLVTYAHKKNVVLVSPSSFYAYLQTIMHGLKLVKMKESMSYFRKNIETLEKHLKTYEVHFSKVGSHLSTTVNAYNNSQKEYKKIDKDIYRLTEKKKGGKVKIELLEKPKENQ